MKKNNMKYFGLFGSMYSLLVYSIVFFEKLQYTAFVLTNDLEIYNKDYEKLNSVQKNTKLRSIIINLKAYLIAKKYPRITKVYGQDHVDGKTFFVPNYDFTLIEDGISNYVQVDNYPKYKTNWLMKKLGLKKTQILGIDKEVEQIILTGIMEVPLSIVKKTTVVDLKEKWNNLKKSEKEKILSLFDLKYKDLILFEGKTVLITQPFSEDNYITEKEKIQIYKKMIELENSENIVIKPHPREKTKYSNIFPNNCIFEKKFPMQLLALEGIEIKKIMTISSTSISEFINNSTTEIVFLGTKVHPKIAENEGEVSFDYESKCFIKGEKNVT